MSDTETETRTTVQRLMTLFEGFAEAHGTYKPDAGPVRAGKLDIKSSARTVRQPVTLELWQRHVAGEYPLGIIPIRDNNTCLWGVIDIDVYDLLYVDLLEQVRKYKLPLVACRSKSGGVHLFLFLAEPAPAELLQDRLREMAALLGYGNAEVFPKQRSVRLDRGDLGNWLNMPYFEGEQTTRHGIKENGLGMSMEEFVLLAESLQQPARFLDQEVRRPVVRSGGGDAGEEGRPSKGDPLFGDGPPCMQHLSSMGVPEGMRNAGLFNLATFAKRKFGSTWEDVVERWNRDYCDPPLPSGEVVAILKSQMSKEYHYECKKQPLAAHCNSTLCRTRKYGVGGGEDYPVVGGMAVLNTDPPLWFLDVDGERIELQTEDLQNYRSFHKLCMERFFRCYKMMKQEKWLEVVSEAMRDVIELETSPEVGNRGKFLEILEDFLLDRHQGERIEELFLGKPYYDADTGRRYFRLKDLEQRLEQSGFRNYARSVITARIKDLGGDRKFFNIKNRGINAWWVHESRLNGAMPNIPTPPLPREPI